MVTPMLNHAAIDRPRHAVASHVAVATIGGHWRLGSVAPTFGGTTGLSAAAFAAYGIAGTKVTSEHTMKRSARHLGTRST